jgi:hypothetical protein
VPATAPTGSELTLLVPGVPAEHAEELITALAAQTDDRWRAWLVGADPLVAGVLARFADRVRSRVCVIDSPPVVSGLVTALRGDDVPLAHLVEEILAAPGTPTAVVVPVVTQEVEPVRWGSEPGWSPVGPPVAVAPTPEDDLPPEVVLAADAALLDLAAPGQLRPRFEAAVREATHVAVLAEPAVLRRVWKAPIPAPRPAVEQQPIPRPRRWRHPFRASRPT